MPLLINPFLDHLAEATIDAVNTALRNKGAGWNTTLPGEQRVLRFKRFAKAVISRVALGMPVLLVTLVYVTRAKPYLFLKAEEWAYERVFVGALMASSKVRSCITL